MFVRKDGATFSFCSNKCFKNMMMLKRIPRETGWTASHKREKEVRLTAEAAMAKGTAKKSATKIVKRVVKTKAAKKKAEKDEKKTEPAKKEADKL